MRGFISILAAGLLAAVPVSASDQTGVPRVVDAGTLEINYQLFQLEGLRFPKESDTCELDGKTWLCGWEAVNALSFIVDRHWVTCRANGKASADVTPAICKSGDILDLNAYMVRKGWARTTPAARKRYGHLERLARREGLGLWRK